MEKTAAMPSTATIDTQSMHAEILSIMEQMVVESDNSDVQRFRAGFAGVDGDWCDVGIRNLPATALFEGIDHEHNSDSEKLLSLVARYREYLLWEQTYRKEDGVVGEALLSGYAFSEITGKHGPFVNDNLRSGVGVWAPHVEYPLHWHEASEIYWVLSGAACFQIGRGQPHSLKKAGDIIFVPSATPHSFHTSEQSLVMFYLWQGGDLRQVSEFECRVAT